MNVLNWFCKSEFLIDESNVNSNMNVVTGIQDIFVVIDFDLKYFYRVDDQFVTQ